MNDALLLSYLNDHLAGSVIAVEMGDHCRNNHADAELVAFLDRLLAEIEEDRNVLKDLISRFGGEQSTAKKSAAWLTEKFGRLKMLSGSDPANVAFSRMEQLETLMLGIRGKLALWEVLAELAPSDTRLTGVDWNKLQQTAADQVKRTDEQRRRAAREAFLTADAPKK
jgi:hypothetical protein